MKRNRVQEISSSSEVTKKTIRSFDLSTSKMVVTETEESNNIVIEVSVKPIYLKAQTKKQVHSFFFNKFTSPSPAVIDMRNQMISNILASFKKEGVLTVREYLKILKESPDDFFRNTRKLDLSENGFVDSDITDIAKLVEHIAQRTQHPIIVDLSNNRFHGYLQKYNEIVMAGLEKIIQNPKVKFLAVYGNPFVGSDTRAGVFKLECENPGKLVVLSEQQKNMKLLEAIFAKELGSALQFVVEQKIENLYKTHKLYHN